MGTLANSEDPDEMPHNAAFHQVLHFMRQNMDSTDPQNSSEWVGLFYDVAFHLELHFLQKYSFKDFPKQEGFKSKLNFYDKQSAGTRKVH